MRLIIYSYMNKQIHSVGNMRPQTNHVFSILVQATLLSIYFPLFLCHNNNQENVNVIAGGVVIRRLAASSVATCVHNPGSKSTVCTATAPAATTTTPVVTAPIAPAATTTTPVVTAPIAPAATTTTPVVTAPIAPAATTTTPVITAPAPTASPAQPRPEPQGPSIPQPSTPLPSYEQQQSTVVKSYKQTGVYINPGLALGVAGVVISAIIITVVCCMTRRCSLEGPNKVGNQDIEKFLLQHGSLALKRYKYSEIKKITKSFRDKLGQGGYGSVYKGVLPDGCLVAVKVLMESDSNGEEFINEVASISRTSHVNIVNLLGFCYDRKKRALVYQYMPNKSLDKFISNADCPLDLQNLYNIAVGVAKGLEYLHTGCNTRIVHFDIKPQNILLDEEFCPKISDFGLAKLCKKKQSILSVLGTRGTIGYIAPEVFSRNFGGVSHKSDVYSYGMMVLEMAGARNTIEVEAIQSSTENYFPDKIYEQVILDVTKKLDGFTFEQDEEIAKKMFLVGFWCIQTIPSDRPSISKVVEMLEGSLGSIQIPPKPVLCIPTLPIQDVSSSFSSYAEAENSAEFVDHPEVSLSINCTK